GVGAGVSTPATYARRLTHSRRRRAIRLATVHVSTDPYRKAGLDQHKGRAIELSGGLWCLDCGRELRFVQKDSIRSDGRERHWATWRHTGDLFTATNGC